MIEIQELKPHEEVIENVVAKLTEEIRAEAVVKDPLIVDQENYVILDGMHRFSSLERLGCRFAPCCLLDYMSPLVGVGAWFRTFMVDGAESVAKEILTNMKVDFSLERVDNIESYAPYAVILTKDQSSFSLSNSTDLLERSRIAAGIEKRMVANGHRVTYLSEAAALRSLRGEGADFVILLPAFTKDAIRKFGSEGLLLPHKVTRHIIPSRPLAIDVPLNLLTDPKITRREADEKLGELLAGKRIDRKPPGSVVDGRRYDEELLLFSG
jgi:hypothetical protein